MAKQKALSTKGDRRKSGTKSVACRYVLIIKRNVFPESGNRHNRLVQDVFGHGVLGAGADDGGNKDIPSSHSAPFSFL